MDGRGAPYGTALYRERRSAIATWVEHHGAIPLPSGVDSLSHILFFKHELPDVYERTRFFLEPMDFLNLRLTGVATANLGSAFMMLLADNRDVRRPRWDETLLSLAEVAIDKLPALVPMRGRAGTLRAEIAEDLGLPGDVPVFASMNDTQAAAIATASFIGGRGGINIGTTCQVLAHVDRKATDFDSHLVSAPSPVADKYLVLAENGLGGAALRHLLEGVLFAPGALGDTTREDPYANVDRAVESTPPGAGGVLFLPWLSGSFFPDEDPFMRGGFINMSLESTREQLVRAVLEGVALNLSAMIDPVERFIGAKFEELAMGGGGALSEQWTQIVADVSGRLVHRLDNPRFVNNVAGALIAFDDMGVRDLRDAKDFVRTAATFEPRSEHRGLYEHLRARQHEAFARIREVCRALNERVQ
jgi:xylulokinase